MAKLVTADGRKSTALTLLTTDALPGWLSRQPGELARFVEDNGFTGAAGQTVLLPQKTLNSNTGARRLVGIAEGRVLESFLPIVDILPAGHYRLSGATDMQTTSLIAQAWLMGSYRFSVSGANGTGSEKTLVWPERCNRDYIQAIADCDAKVRNMINMPANLFGPAELAAEATALANHYKAKLNVTTGKALVENNFPAIWAVGRVAERRPRLIDMQWGRASDPLVVIVGKGVCFDSGGLNLKNSQGMKNMKKDMAGAAHALGLAELVMRLNLPLSLRVIIPAVDNMPAPGALCPGDVIHTRAGYTVEVANTDAEGRLILADALALAESANPQLVIDFATLTAGARAALGTEIVPYFSSLDSLAEQLELCAKNVSETVWRLPLHHDYSGALASRVADLRNIGGNKGGSIVAALFLNHFMRPEIPWLHFDIYGWNDQNRKGCAEGGLTQGMRAALALLQKRFTKNANGCCT